MVLRPGLRRYVILPIMINIILFTSAFVLLYEQLDDWLHNLLPYQLTWLTWLIMPLLFLALSLGVFYSFGLIANLIGSPFSSQLAQTIELQLGGHPPSANANLKGTLRSTFIGLMTQLSALLYQLIRLVPLMLLFWVPGINLIATLVLIGFSTWMLALAYMATPMGNHDMAFREVRDICGQHKALVFGLGTGLLLLTWIPGLNLLVLSAGTAAATTLWVDRLAPYRQS